MIQRIRALARSSRILRPIWERLRRWDRAAGVPGDGQAAEKQVPSADELHSFWTGTAPEGNVPEEYLEPIDRSRALLSLIEFLPREARILEVGCNVGRNLNVLYNAGFHGVEGIEISPHAVRILREAHPDLADVPVHLGAAEDILPTMRSGSFDLVYTMAVLQHIHPDSVSVFDDIARVTYRILAIERTIPGSSSRTFPHDIPAIFKARGFDLVDTTPVWDIPQANFDLGLKNYSAYSFVRSGSAVAPRLDARPDA